MRTTTWFSTSVLCLILGLLAVSCNSEERRYRGAPFDPQRSTVSCFNGESEFCGRCARGSTLSEMCSWVGGSMVESDLCRCPARVQLSNWKSTEFPARKLNPNSQAPQKTYLGVALKKGETLTLQASGFWSNDTGFLTCREDGLVADVNGKGESGTKLPDYDGKHQGLLISDGTTVYEAGSNASINIQNNGYLFMGFNVPSGEGDCSKLAINLSVSHCVNQNNEIAPCPSTTD